MAPDTNTARGKPSSAAVGGSAVNTGPFTPQQQRALMKLAGGPLAQSASLTAHPYQHHQQQQHHALMLQMQMQAHAAQQQRHAFPQTAYLPGFPVALQQQQQQHHHQQAGSPHLNLYPTMGHLQGGLTPQLHARPVLHSPAAHHHPVSSINGRPSGFEGALQTPQHALHPFIGTPFHGSYSPAHHPLPGYSPPSQSSQTFRQYCFVGGEPTNAYRLVTQSQLAHLQTTPNIIPASLHTPALQTVSIEASVGQPSHGPTISDTRYESTITMSSPVEEGLQQEQHRQHHLAAGQRSTSSSISSMDISDSRTRPATALPAAGLLPNASSSPPPNLQQQQVVRDADIRLLSDRTPPLPVAQQSQSHAPASDKLNLVATSRAGSLPSDPTSAVSSTSSASVYTASATPKPITIVTGGSAAGENGVPNSSTQVSPSSSSSSSSTTNLSSPPNTASLIMPKGQHAKTTSQNGVNGKKAHKKQKQARKPTLTVDTSVLPPQATVPAAVAIQNPVIDVVPAQLPPNAIYQVSNVLQHPAYVVEMQPLQTTALYTQASPPGYATLRTLQLNHALTSAFKKQETGAIDQCVAEYFHRDGKLKFSMSEEGRDEPSNEYLIPTCAIPRFYESMRRCGATSIKLVLDDPQEWLLTAESGTVMTEDGTSGYMVECPSATLIVSYSSGSTVFSRGTCRATYHYQQAEPLFDKHGRLLSSGYPQMTLLLSQLEYDFVEHTEMVNRSAIKTRTTVSPSKALNSTTADVGIDQTPDIPRPSDTDVAEDPRPAKRPKTEYTTSKDSTDVRQTTQPSQTALKRNESNSNWQECSIPGPPVRDTGLSDESMRVLEIGEAVDHLGELICFSLINNLSPLEALEHYATLSVKAGFVPDPRLGEAGHGIRHTQEARIAVGSGAGGVNV